MPAVKRKDRDQRSQGCVFTLFIAQFIAWEKPGEFIVRPVCLIRSGAMDRGVCAGKIFINELTLYAIEVICCRLSLSTHKRKNEMFKNEKNTALLVLVMACVFVMTTFCANPEGAANGAPLPKQRIDYDDPGLDSIFGTADDVSYRTITYNYNGDFLSTEDLNYVSSTIKKRTWTLDANNQVQIRKQENITSGNFEWYSFFQYDGNGVVKTETRFIDGGNTTWPESTRAALLPAGDDTVLNCHEIINGVEVITDPGADGICDYVSGGGDDTLSFYVVVEKDADNKIISETIYADGGVDGTVPDVANDNSVEYRTFHY